MIAMGLNQGGVTRWLRVGLLVMALGSSAALACRGPFPPLEKTVERAQAIFVGKVISVSKSDGGRDLVIRFEVEEALKGSLGKTIEVFGDSTTCGFGAFLEQGKRVLVFASGTPLATSAIERNRGLRDPKEEAALKAQVKALLAKAPQK